MHNQFKILLIEAIQHQNPYLDQPIEPSQSDDAELYSEAG